MPSIHDNTELNAPPCPVLLTDPPIVVANVFFLGGCDASGADFLLFLFFAFFLVFLTVASTLGGIVPSPHGSSGG